MRVTHQLNASKSAGHNSSARNSTIGKGDELTTVQGLLAATASILLTMGLFAEELELELELDSLTH